MQPDLNERAQHLLKVLIELVEAIVIPQEHILDLLIIDMDKIETRLQRVEEPQEKEMLEKCLHGLEQEKPLSDLELNRWFYHSVKILVQDHQVFLQSQIWLEVMYL